MKNKVLKSTGAILCGFLISIILSIGTDLILEKTGLLNTKPFDANPNWLIVFVILYRCIYNTTGSYFTARLAPGRPLRLAMIGGVIGLAITLGTSGAGAEELRGRDIFVLRSGALVVVGATGEAARPNVGRDRVAEDDGAAGLGVSLSLTPCLNGR